MGQRYKFPSFGGEGVGWFLFALALPSPCGESWMTAIYNLLVFLLIQQ